MTRLCRHAVLALLTLSALAGASAQEPVTRQPVPAEPGAQDAPQGGIELERGRTLLRRHGEQSRLVRVLVADYVQRRTTTLSKVPLVSSGTFLFVKKPACAVFRANKPRSSIVRLAADRYEVFRPGRKRLERFLLRGPQLSGGLFAAVGGDIDRLLRDFELRGSRVVAADAAAKRDRALEIRLVPKKDELRRRLSELLVTLRCADAALQVVAYRDAGGDLVAITLANLRIDPADAPTVDFDVPKDTEIIEHAPERAGRARR